MTTPEGRCPTALGFFDGQNLFRRAKRVFGHSEPNFDPVALHREVSLRGGFQPGAIYFYTGMPAAKHQPRWHTYWENKIAAMRADGVHVTTRPLRYRERFSYDDEGKIDTFTEAEEKGIDIRIALDLVRIARRGELEAAIIYSQDQDLNEALTELEAIAAERQSEFAIASAFPVSPKSTFNRGVDRTQWIEIDKSLYDHCLDRRTHF